MSNQQEALRLALEALKKSRDRIVEQGGSGWKLHAQQCVNAITAIKEALAEQPAQQQEPVARSKAYDMIDRFLRNNLNSDDDYAEYSTALDSLYTSPPASKPLTDKEIDVIISNVLAATSPRVGYRDIARAIEQAHGIKG